MADCLEWPCGGSELDGSWRCCERKQEANRGGCLKRSVVLRWLDWSATVRHFATAFRSFSVPFRLLSLMFFGPLPTMMRWRWYRLGMVMGHNKILWKPRQF